MTRTNGLTLGASGGPPEGKAPEGEGAGISAVEVLMAFVLRYQ
jgi:hypothetical protein